METRMPYWLYKKGYTMYPHYNYSSQDKSITVMLPEYDKPQFPEDWKLIGGCFITPIGIQVFYWNTGLAERFQVRWYEKVKEFNPGLRARENMIDYVRRLDLAIRLERAQ
jgi:hypothetical protein